jgi:hypothetical protein
MCGRIPYATFTWPSGLSVMSSFKSLSRSGFDNRGIILNGCSESAAAVCLRKSEFHTTEASQKRSIPVGSTSVFPHLCKIVANLKFTPSLVLSFDIGSFSFQ